MPLQLIKEDRTEENILAVYIMTISYCVSPQMRVVCVARQCLETTKNLILFILGAAALALIVLNDLFLSRSCCRAPR